MRGDRRFHAVSDELHALLHFADFLGNGGLAQLDTRAGFINYRKAKALRLLLREW